LSFNIAVAGKGGTGKTSITSLVIRYLKSKQKGPILAVDADANANLGDSLGLQVGQTVGSIIAGFNQEKINIPSGMTKESYLEFKLNDAIVESKGLDLITMGRGEGPDCYCYPNLLLRKVLDELAGSYAYMVMDNEAGMEHLSRRTTQNIDALLLVSDSSVKGIRTVARLIELVKELKLVVKRQSVIVNFAHETLDPLLEEEMKRLNIETAAIIPVDENIREYDLKSKSLLDMPEDSGAVKGINALMTHLLENVKIEV
jgi:CO dehydrogenase maturation factor